MNLFYLSHDPDEAARWHLDKHIVKMPLESAQILSTAQRLLDGVETHFAYHDSLGREKIKKAWLLEGEMANLSYSDRHLPRIEIPNRLCYQVTHARHPTTMWTMATRGNYELHVDFFIALLDEYELRYGRPHSTTRLLNFLVHAPKNLTNDEVTPVPQAMPEHYKGNDAVAAYRRYYAGDKWRFAKWKTRQVPDWFIPTMKEVWPLTDAEKLAKVAKRRTPPCDQSILEAAACLGQSA